MHRTQARQLAQQGKHADAVREFIVGNSLEDACKTAEAALNNLYNSGQGEQLV